MNYINITSDDPANVAATTSQYVQGDYKLPFTKGQPQSYALTFFTGSPVHRTQLPGDA